MTARTSTARAGPTIEPGGLSVEGAGDERRRQQGEERQQFHRDVADQEVDSVSGPTRTKSALLRIQRKQALQGDENDGEQHDVQDKPVEPDPERRRAAADFDGASAGKDRRHTEKRPVSPSRLEGRSRILRAESRKLATMASARIARMVSMG